MNRKCTQVIEVEDLVLGTIEGHRGVELRRHVEGCAECLAELRTVEAEVALFARRADMQGGPPPALAVAIEERLAAEASPVRTVRAVRSFMSSVGHTFIRGHFTAAAAAALFVIAAFSRLGAGNVAAITTIGVGTDESAIVTSTASNPSSGSNGEEPLACVAGGSSGESASTSEDVGSRSFASPSFGSSLLASLRGTVEVPACTAPALDTSTGASIASLSACDRASSVTCASYRQ